MKKKTLKPATDYEKACAAVLRLILKKAFADLRDSNLRLAKLELDQSDPYNMTLRVGVARER